MHMIISSKNKENIPQKKKLSKDTKPLKSRKLALNCCPLKNESLQHINRSLDLSDVTVGSSRKEIRSNKSKRKRIVSSKNSSECELLKQQQKTKKIIPIPLDQQSLSFIKRPLSEKTVKPRNSRKQSQYVSYLVQAQRMAMNSLASIDNNSELTNCHQISNLESLNNNEIGRLRQEMNGLRQRFERLQSEHNEKETIVSSIQDEQTQKSHQTIQMATIGTHKQQLDNRMVTQDNTNNDYKTLQIQKNIQKDVTEKYTSIISEYEKMFTFYKERLEVCERDFQTEKQREKLLEDENQRLKGIIHGKQQEIQRKQRVFESERVELKEEITILEKSLNKKNKELLLKNEEIGNKENELKQKDAQISQISFLFNKQNKQKSHQHQTLQKQMQQRQRQQIRSISEKHLTELVGLENQWRQKVKQIEIQSSGKQTQFKSTIDQLEKQLTSLEEKFNRKQEQLVGIEAQFRQKQSDLVDNMKEKEQLGTTKIQAISQEFESKIRILEEQISQMNSLLTEKECENQQQKYKTNSLHQTISLLQKQLQAVQLQQQTSLSQTTQLNNTVSELKRNLTQKDFSLQTLTNHLTQKDTQIQKLKNLLISFTTEVKQIKVELGSNEEYFEEMEAQRQNLAKEIRREKEIYAKEREIMLNEREKLSVEVDRVKTKLNRVEDELRISYELNSLKENEIRAEMSKKIDSINQQLTSKSSTINTQALQLSTLQSRTTLLLEQKQHQVQSLQQQTTTLLSQIQSLSAQNRSLLEAKDSILSQKQTLLSKLWKLNESITLNNDLVIEMKERHVNQLAAKEQTIGELLREVERVKAEKQMIERDVGERTREATGLREQIVGLMDEGEKRLMSIKEKHEQKLANWKGEMDAVKSELQEKCKEVEDTRNELQIQTQTLTQKDQHIATLQQTLTDYEQKVRRLQNTISQNNQTITSLKSQNKQLSTHLETVTSELQSLSSRYEESQQSYRQFTERKKQEMEEVFVVCEENKREIIESMRGKIDQLVREIEGWERKVKERDGQIEKLLKEGEVVGLLEKQVDQLKKKLLQCVNAHKISLNQIKKLQEKNQQLQSTLILTRQQSQSLQSNIISLERKISTLTQQITIKNASNEKLLLQISQNKEKHTNLLQKITILKDQNQSIISTYNYQLQQRKQIIEDLMKEKRLLYQKLNGE